MELNQECVRDVLLITEKEVGLRDVVDENWFKQQPGLAQYDFDTVVYTVSKLIEAHYLKGDIQITFESTGIMVSSLTMSGHNFLDNIRDDGVWKETKIKAKSISNSVSVKILSELAGAFLKAKLGL